MEIEFIGGIASPKYSQKEFVKKMERYLATQPIIETKTMIIDVVNLFQREFMCCKENCDCRVLYEGDDKHKLFNEPGRVVSCDRGCCEGGSLEIPSDLIKNIDKDFDGILEYMMPECANLAKVKGWKKKISKTLTGIRSFPKDNRCIFTIIDDGMNYCALHRYALMNGKNIMDYKPFECAMFPMDILKVDGKYLLTSISEIGDTYGLLRWGDNHAIQSCLRKSCGGIPFYEYSKDIIVELLGAKKYELIDKIYKTKKWKKLLKEE